MKWLRAAAGGLAIALALVSPALAQFPPGVGPNVPTGTGGSSTITAGTTATNCAANTVLYSDGTRVQCSATLPSGLTIPGYLTSVVSGTTPLTCTSGTAGVLYQSSGTAACDSGFTYAGNNGTVTMGGGLFVTGNVTVANSQFYTFSGRGGIAGPADGTLQILNNAGTNRINIAVSGGNPGLATFNGSISTPNITASSIATDSTQTATATVCEDTTTHLFYFGSGTGGICKGTSGRQFKRDIRDLDDLGLANVIQLAPKRYFNRPGIGLDSDREQVGLIADEVRQHLPPCADENTVDYLCVSVLSLNAIKGLAARVFAIERKVN